MADQPDRERADQRVEPAPLDERELELSGGTGDLGAESGTAPGQPAWGTRARAPGAGEGVGGGCRRDDAGRELSGGPGDLGAEAGTAPGQPAWGTRALAPSAGEGLWVG